MSRYLRPVRALRAPRQRPSSLHGLLSSSATSSGVEVARDILVLNHPVPRQLFRTFKSNRPPGLKAPRLWQQQQWHNNLVVCLLFLRQHQGVGALTQFKEVNTLEHRWAGRRQGLVSCMDHLSINKFLSRKGLQAGAQVSSLLCNQHQALHLDVDLSA